MKPMTLRDVLEDWLRLFDPQQSLKNALLAELAKAAAAVAYCNECDKWLKTVISKTATDEQRRIADQQYDNARIAWLAARDAAAKFQSNQ